MTESVGREMGGRAYGTLTEELLSLVVTYLPEKDAVEAMSVSKHWRT